MDKGMPVEDEVKPGIEMDWKWLWVSVALGLLIWSGIGLVIWWLLNLPFLPDWVSGA